MIASLIDDSRPGSSVVAFRAASPIGGLSCSRWELNATAIRPLDIPLYIVVDLGSPIWGYGDVWRTLMVSGLSKMRLCTMVGETFPFAYATLGSC